MPDLPGLRPTPDRTRETLFNWLAPRLHGAHCLDLFAGSGALGFEALSRGAGSVCMVEQAGVAVHQLRVNAATLKAERLDILHSNALEFLSSGGDRPPTDRPFDIVFLDPPFRQGLLAGYCEALEQRGWLAPTAAIYLEAEQEHGSPTLPTNWEIIRHGRAGQVAFHLAERMGG